MNINVNEMIIWSPGVTLEDIEKQVILKAFKFYRGNKTVTANALGVAIRTLDNKFEKYAEEETKEKEREENEQRKRNEWLIRAKGNMPNNINGGIFPESTGAETTKAPSAENAARLRVEPSKNTTEKQSLSLPQRKKV